ncbi:4'-phosphopantetheinyl transferase superfamily protein [Streptomyces orinoci]|uniref:4'-phosphopantetheinyl transferase superfamily protein n=1 Tax=Streptomyces orinoci TaxID=67339 RepID=A0ABV3K813_STRON|nr:4'-phosphopantetheinyl transferase superfamily protein [Streptomyces orinoci]
MRVPVLAVWTRRPLAVDTLTRRERERLAAVPPRARRQWLISRHALKVLLGLLGLPPDTTAHTFPHWRLSLSHTDGAAVAAGTAMTHQHGLGVDLEADRTAPVDTSRFFLDPRERSWLDSLPQDARAAHRLRLWTVKEALFKADPLNHRTVLPDYITADPAARCGRARARPHPGTLFGYSSARLHQGHLSFAVAIRPRSPVPESERPVPALTFDDVAQRISATLSIPVEQLTPGTRLRELAADSFRLVEMAVDLQEEFDTVFTQHELREITTLGELAGLVGVRA